MTNTVAGLHTGHGGQLCLPGAWHHKGCLTLLERERLALQGVASPTPKLSFSQQDRPHVAWPHFTALQQTAPVPELWRSKPSLLRSPGQSEAKTPSAAHHPAQPRSRCPTKGHPTLLEILPAAWHPWGCSRGLLPSPGSSWSPSKGSSWLRCAGNAHSCGWHGAMGPHHSAVGTDGHVWFPVFLGGHGRRCGPMSLEAQLEGAFLGRGMAGQSFFPSMLLCSLSFPGAVRRITLFAVSSLCVSVKTGKRRFHQADVQCRCVWQCLLLSLRPGCCSEGHPDIGRKNRRQEPAGKIILCRICEMKLSVSSR